MSSVGSFLAALVILVLTFIGTAVLAGLWLRMVLEVAL